MNSAYSILAPFYDRLNGGSVDYDRWAAFIQKIFQQNGVSEHGLVLDLACGTGKITSRLAAAGYDLIGVDLSPDMLSLARENCAAEGYYPLFLCQDMCQLDLYGTVEGAVCCLDSLNYLTADGELDEVFSRLKNFISPGGILLFDVNTQRKFTEIYGQNCYTYEQDDLYCVWQNDYHPKSRICQFDLVFFEKTKNGLYRRQEEHQEERYYSPEKLAETVETHGFEILNRVSDFSFRKADENDLRHYYICRRKKDSL